jgi:hypothetical protein
MTVGEALHPNASCSFSFSGLRSKKDVVEGKAKIWEFT